MKNAHLTTTIFLYLRTGKLYKSGYTVYPPLYHGIYSLFTSLPVDIQYIHFLQAKAHLEVYIPIYTTANGQSDH